jgi:hypothetical protein
VILLEVDTVGIPGVKFEYDGPWPVYIDRVALGIELKQSLRIKSRQVNILHNRRRIQGVQPSKKALLKTGVNLGPSALPQVLQFFVSKRLDRGVMKANS